MREKPSLELESKEKISKERHSIKKDTSYHYHDGKQMRSASPKEAYLIELISFP
jgi:hypothetical protein